MSMVAEYLTKLEQARASIASEILTLTVDIPPDPEEGSRSIVVTSYFDVDADTAFLYWDEIGRTMEAWASGPDEDTAADVLELISTNIRWRE
jgi:hypothetical protein